MSEDTYDELAAVYDAFFGPAAQVVWENGIGAELKARAPHVRRVLDLGAGTGAGASILSTMLPGVEVTVLDESRAMLEQAEVPPQRRIVADLAEFEPFEEPFDAVVSGFTTLNHLAPDRLLECFARVSRALAPEGLFVFDYCSRRLLVHDAMGPPADLPEAYETGKRLHRGEHRFEHTLNRSRTYLSLHEGDHTLMESSYVQYALDPFILDELAATCGLRTLAVRDVMGTGFTPAHPNHLYVMSHSPSS